MKFFHISDLHIGKLLHGYNLKKDQQEVLKQIIDKAREIKPDAIIMAGDIYDKSVPSAEAVTIFDNFLTELSELTSQIPILIISGNHDSAERLEFASQILNKHHIYIAGMPPRTELDHIRCVTIKDTYGDVDFYLLPFVKPGYVRTVFAEPIESYDEAVKGLITRENIDYSKRNVLITHQFYTAGSAETKRCDSELITVGGVDNVDIESVSQFDYVAMGHIHGAQKVGSDTMRYCGTPMKYSISEKNQKKGFVIVNIEQKGNVTTEFIELRPLHEVREMKGKLNEIVASACEDNRDDYVSITITDEVDIYRPKDQLSDVYSNILEIRIDNDRIRKQLTEIDEVETVTEPFVIFEQFFEKMQGRDLTIGEKEIMSEIINDAKEGQGI